MAIGRKQPCMHTLLLPYVFLWINYGATPGMAPIVARNVPAIADTGPQTNVRSLRHFLVAGFDRSILIPASDLVAANHSGINIVGAFFAVNKGLDANKTEVQCHAMMYVSADVSQCTCPRLN